MSERYIPRNPTRSGIRSRSEGRSAVSGTFATKAMRYHRGLRLRAKLAQGVSIMDPFRAGRALDLSDAFLRKYFDDRDGRILIFGINPGRFGAGLTGVAFTDPIRLQEDCGIRNDLPKKPEPSATFIYGMIKSFGGPTEFYSKFYLGATCPLGFVHGDKNYNFYDDPGTMSAVTPFIIAATRAQIGFGARTDVAFILGTGKLRKFWERLNAEHRFFKRLVFLEHPRFINQYRRKRMGEYVRKYVKALRSELPESAC